jgi:hypothetical protein
MLNILNQPGCPAKRNNQHSGRCRIERACMPDAPLPAKATNPCHDFVRCHTGGFINVKKSMHVVI